GFQVMWTSPVRDPGESIGTFTLPQRRSPVTGTCEDGDFGLLRLAQVDRVDRVLRRGRAFLDGGEAGGVEHAGGELPSPHGAETGSSARDIRGRSPEPRHGCGSTRSQEDSLLADEFAFLLDQ